MPREELDGHEYVEILNRQGDHYHVRLLGRANPNDAQVKQVAGLVVDVRRVGEDEIEHF